MLRSPFLWALTLAAASEVCKSIRDDYTHGGCCEDAPPSSAAYQYRGICMSHLVAWTYVKVDVTSAVNEVYGGLPYNPYAPLEGHYVPSLILNCPGSLAAYPFLANLYTLDGIASPPACGALHVDYQNFMGEVFGNETLLGMDVYRSPPTLQLLIAPEPLTPPLPAAFTTTCADIQHWYARVQAAPSFDEAWRGNVLSTGTSHWNTVVRLAGLTGCEITYTGPTYTVADYTIRTNDKFTLPLDSDAVKDAMRNPSGNVLKQALMSKVQNGWTPP